jgi:hypothetical protein
VVTAQVDRRLITEQTASSDVKMQEITL